MSGMPEGYIDVASRIAAIKGAEDRQYPQGSFQPWGAEPFRVITVGDTTYLAFTAAFYRTPDDPRPGVGSAWEQVPGRTNFTKGSELQNAETSAWGRALVAALAADTKQGVSSADEVRNRRAEQEPRPPAVTDKAWLADFDARILTAHDDDTLAALWKELAAAFNDGRLTEPDRNTLVASWTDRKASLIGAAV